MAISKRLLDLVGNVPEDYEVHSRVAVPREVVVTGDCAIKLYQMLVSESKPFDNQELGFFRAAIRTHLNFGKVSPRSGLGFAIASEDVLNITMIGGKYPSLLTPHVFSYNREDLGLSFNQEDIREAGAFCTWEAKIASYEAEAWIECMRQIKESKGKAGRRRAKMRYLSSFFQGTID